MGYRLNVNSLRQSPEEDCDYGDWSIPVTPNPEGQAPPAEIPGATSREEGQPLLVRHQDPEKPFTGWKEKIRSVQIVTFIASLVTLGIAEWVPGVNENRGKGERVINMHFLG